MPSKQNFILTMNVDHDSLGDRRGNTILSNAEIRATISSGQLGQDQIVTLDTILHWCIKQSVSVH